jgi:hypothetical protein
MITDSSPASDVTGDSSIFAERSKQFVLVGGVACIGVGWISS